MGDVDGLVPLSPCQHLDLSGAHPLYELWDHLFSGAKGDGVVDMAQVGLEATGDVDNPQLSLEVGDLESLGGELLAYLLFPCVAFVQLSTGSEGAAMDGGNEAVCDGVDGFISVGMRVEEHLGCAGRYWGVFLFSFMGGDGETEQGRVFIGQDVDVDSG